MSGVDQRGLLDTSVFAAQEAGNTQMTLPDLAAVSVVTTAELYLGVLAASAPDVRAQRLRTLTAVQRLFDPLPIDDVVARTFAELVDAARREGRRPAIMDTWIAATAVAHDMPVYTQDRGFSTIPKVDVVFV